MERKGMSSTKIAISYWWNGLDLTGPDCPSWLLDIKLSEHVYTKHWLVRRRPCKKEKNKASVFNDMNMNCKSKERGCEFDSVKCFVHYQHQIFSTMNRFKFWPTGYASPKEHQYQRNQIAEFAEIQFLRHICKAKTYISREYDCYARHPYRPYNRADVFDPFIHFNATALLLVIQYNSKEFP